MSDEFKRESQGDFRRDFSDRDSDQKGQARSFVQAGLEHINYKNPATIVTFGIVGFFVFAGGVTLSAYIVGSSKVEELIFKKAASSYYDRDHTVFEKIQSQDKDIWSLQRDTKECLSYRSELDEIWKRLDQRNVIRRK